MQLTAPNVFGPPADRREALLLLREVVDSGVDPIDTAQYYGPGVVNELIRQALYPLPGSWMRVDPGRQRMRAVSPAASTRKEADPCPTTQ
jgi:hypothetical protein